MIGLGKVVIGIVGAAVVSTAVMSTSATPVSLAAWPEADSATVTHIVDGDTIDVDIDGSEVRIRLLNIDTPETVDPSQPVQCLGPEASAFLEAMIPVGTAVRLEYDDVRTDRYGRTLAGVFGADDVLVNAEIARAGLGTAVEYDDNVRFLPPVEAAQQEAIDAARGLHSPDLACTPEPAPQPLPEQTPYPGYYGPRCYEPGGRVWHPCAT